MKKASFACLSILLGVILCLCLGEIFIRIYNYTNGKRRTIFIPHPCLGFVHAKNNRFRYKDGIAGEFSTWHITNAFGLMGRPVKLKKSKNIYRILILGDSFTEALQVDHDKKFTTLLEEKFHHGQSPPDGIYEVLNAGLSGTSPIVYYLYFIKELKWLNPDLVLVQLFANDLFEDHKIGAMSIFNEQGYPVKINRYFLDEETFRITQQIASTDKALEKAHAFLMETSRLYEYIYAHSFKRHKKSEIHQEMAQLPKYFDHYQFFIVNPLMPLYHDEEFRHRTWQQTQKYLLALKNEVEKRGGEFGLFYIPLEAQLSLSEYSQHSRQYFPEQANREINQLLENLSREEGINYLDFLPIFEEHKQQRLYFNIDGHLTERGHQVIAEQLYTFIKESYL